MLQSIKCMHCSKIINPERPLIQVVVMNHPLTDIDGVHKHFCSYVCLRDSIILGTEGREGLRVYYATKK